MHRKFLRDFLICLVPCVIAGYMVVHAYFKGGFKLGIDLQGGTILIYEVDQERERQRRSLEKGDGRSASAKGENVSQALAESIKRRIDPDDVQNIIVRPAGADRIEIVLPAGSDVDKIRRLVEQVGSLEFRILANGQDDSKAFGVAETLFKDSKPEELDALALGGDLPPAPEAPPDDPFMFKGAPAKYAWVELAPNERAEMGSSDQNKLGLLNANEAKGAQPTELWLKLREAREKHEVYVWAHSLGGSRKHQAVPTSNLLFSRRCTNVNLTPELREKKKYEYFILTRSSDQVLVDGTRVTISATAGRDEGGLRPAIHFKFNTEGGKQFFAVTNRNKPEQDGRMLRQLSIILNGEMISSPSLNAAISDSGMITGDFDQDKVNETVKLLRSGALPATLKQKPVAENSVGPTLGADTIKSGTRAVGAAYLTVLLFMLCYYRFAGMVACIALLCNLLLTVGFMVAVNATFTLPGLAGLVLMLGMAVDANILIYERLREERDAGANLMMAIRNAYDRAFGTIIDTHLSSIFTAIVLYAVGNDQLRGFGISLAVGLVISLFTSLFMTHLLFDYWQKRHWLKELRMMRILTKPKIDFMKLRRIMFPITGALTLLGLGVFLFHGERGLNVDFVGGTVYGGQLQKEITIGKLRDLVSETRQEQVLAVDSVKQLPVDTKEGGGAPYEIKYADGEVRVIHLARLPEGATEEEQLNNLKKRASQLPDSSVEQNFLSTSSRDASKFFTVRTTEREPELVQAAIDRLFKEKSADGKVESLLATTKLAVKPVEGDRNAWTLDFTDSKGDKVYASEAYIRTLLERRFHALLGDDAKDVPEVFRLQGQGDPNKDGRYADLKLTLSLAAQKIHWLPGDTKAKVLDKVAEDYNQSPQPERLETFDATLAGDMRTRALMAILASWIALLMYLWFRFGNWTFGLAAVLCLIHDLCFTIGAIGVSHYLYDTAVGKLLGLQDFKIDFTCVAALLTLVGYSVNEIIVNFARIREVRGKNPLLTPDMINTSVNNTLSRTILTSTTVWLVVMVLYAFGGSGVHLFAFVMVVGVIVGTYSSIYVASPLLLLFGEGSPEKRPGGTSIIAKREPVSTT